MGGAAWKTIPGSPVADVAQQAQVEGIGICLTRRARVRP